MNEEIPYFEDQKDKVQPDKPTVERNAANAVLYDPRMGTILCLEWPKFEWKTFIIGGIEEGEDVVEAAKREILEETGYKNIQFISELGKTKAAFYAAHKGVNRIAHNTGFLFELMGDEQEEVSEEEKEKHFIHWISKETVSDFINIEPQLHVWKRALEILNQQYGK